jgi:opacity protein-like surface antigen
MTLPIRAIAYAGAVAGSLLLCNVAALAEGAAPRFEVTPFAGYRMGGEFEVPSDSEDAEESVDLESDASYGIDLGLYRDRYSFYELLYSRQEASLDSSDAALGGVDVSVQYWHVGGTAMFPQDDTWFLPYLSLTIGATILEPESGAYDSETKFPASLGGGLRLPVNDNLAVTLGLRGYLTFIKSDTDLFCVSGLEGATCLLRSSGSTFFQGEASLGLTVRF